MSTSSKHFVFFSIAGTLALGPLIWFVATVLAPALLPAPEPRQMRLVPVEPRRATVNPAASPRPIAAPAAFQTRTPEPIADRWRFRADGALELTMDIGPGSLPFNPLNRSQP